MDIFNHVAPSAPHDSAVSAFNTSIKDMGSVLNRHIADKTRAYEAAHDAYHKNAHDNTGHAQAQHELFHTGKALVDAKLAEHHFNYLHAQHNGDAKKVPLVHNQMETTLNNTLRRHEAIQRDQNKTAQLADPVKAALITSQRLLLDRIDASNHVLQRHNNLRNRISGDSPSTEKLKNLNAYYQQTRQELSDSVTHYHNNLSRVTPAR